MELTADIKKTLNLNVSMVALAANNLGVTEDNFKERFEDVIKEVQRMQEATVAKVLDNHHLKENAEKVLCARVYLKAKILPAVSEALNHTNF